MCYLNKDLLYQLLSIGENCEIEFKASKYKLPNSVWETYSAFCNTRGGNIVLGVIEKKSKGAFEIEGVENISNIQKDFWDTINNKNKVNYNSLTDDDLKIMKIENKNIIIIDVRPVDRTLKPIYLNNNPMTGTYKRNYEGDYLCTEKEVRNMITESSIKTKDTIILEDMNIENINKETLESYRNRFKNHRGKEHEWNSLSDSDFLKVIGAIDRKTGNLTVAGLLIFGNEEDIVKVATNYFLDYRETLSNNEIERWSHRITSWDGNWSGNLFDFYNRIIGRLTIDIEVPFELDESMTRIENTEIHECVREALVNTLVHSAFFQNGSIVVEKGINYFTFANPGNMRVPFERAKQGGESDPRNRLVHKIFSLVGLGERAGSGIYKITSVWRKKGWAEPEILELYNPDRTVLKLIMKKESGAINGAINGVINGTIKLTRTEKKIVEIISANSNITSAEIAENTQIPYRTVQRGIANLKEKGILTRVGANRNGYWKIIV